MKRLALILSLLAGTAAQAFETAATGAYVVDLKTGTVLMDKNADVPLPPASMSKLMTLNMLFEALQDGRVTMETQFNVSPRARAMGGSTMFLNERDRPTVEDLIRGIIVQSGNDATVVVAEGLAGTEEAFAQLMTQRAQQLGMENASFANASGWPDPGQRMSMKDLAILAERLITEFPDYYPYFAEEEFPFDGRAPDNRFNRNPLLGLGIGADGLKTGHTQEAGYGLTGSAKQGDRRIVFAFTGLDSSSARRQEAERIVSWAFRQFVEKEVAPAGLRVAAAPVWLGNASTVGLVVPDDIVILSPAFNSDSFEARAVFDAPIDAPISAGQEVGTLVISRGDLPDYTVPLVAERDVAAGGPVSRVQAAVGHLLGGFLGGDEETVEAPVAEEATEGT